MVCVKVGARRDKPSRPRYDDDMWDPSQVLDYWRANPPRSIADKRARAVSLLMLAIYCRPSDLARFSIAHCSIAGNHFGTVFGARRRPRMNPSSPRSSSWISCRRSRRRRATAAPRVLSARTGTQFRNATKTSPRAAALSGRWLESQDHRRTAFPGRSGVSLQRHAQSHAPCGL